MALESNKTATAMGSGQAGVVSTFYRFLVMKAPLTKLFSPSQEPQDESLPNRLSDILTSAISRWSYWIFKTTKTYTPSLV